MNEQKEAARFPLKREYTREQIDEVRRAIEHEKEVKAMHDKQERELADMQERYDKVIGAIRVLSKEADYLRDTINELKKVEYDWSDETTIAAAESMLADMERVYAEQEGESKG